MGRREAPHPDSLTEIDDVEALETFDGRNTGALKDVSLPTIFGPAAPRRALVHYASPASKKPPHLRAATCC